MELLTPAETAQRLKMGKSTLRQMRAEGRGPEWVQTGHKTIRYSSDSVDEYIKQLFETGEVENGEG